MNKIPLLPEKMGNLIIERKEKGKSIAEYADGVLDMYNAVVQLLKEENLIILKKGYNYGQKKL